jgi:diacylglycerol kinase (ATP)
VRQDGVKCRETQLDGGSGGYFLAPERVGNGGWESFFRKQVVRIALIVNAKSPEVVEDLRAEVNRLREQDHEVWPRLTFEAGDASRFARELAAEGAELIVAAGGDGTINEVVNGIHEHLSRRGRRKDGAKPPAAPRLGIVPLGTANDLARNLGVPETLREAFEVAVRGTSLAMDVGLVNDRCFLNVSTGGFGAEATGEAPAAAKRALGTLAYLIEGVRRFAALEPSAARFAADGEVLHEGPFLLFAVGNARRTGGGTELTPHAEVGDDLLDVCVVRELSRVEFLALLPDLRSGEHLEHPAVIYRQVAELEVDAEVKLHVNADGEPLHECRFRYRVSPHRLGVMVPRPSGA